MEAKITRLNPHSLPDVSDMGYSQISIVEPGRMAYVSGQVAVHADGRPTPESLVEQAVLAASNAQSALVALGATPNEIVMLRVFMTDLNDDTLAEAFPALMAFLDGARPSITGVGVAALAAPNLKIELELTVRLPD